MSTAQTEFEAISRLSKADRNFRLVQYAIFGLIALLFLFAAMKLIDLEQKFAYQREKILMTAEELAKDGRIRDEEERRYITCLLLVPIQDRSIELQELCHDYADLPGGLTGDNFETINPGELESLAKPTVQSSPSSFEEIISESSYFNNSDSRQDVQPNSSQELQ